ncbi:MAG: hypothetical protein A2096_13680 [Spirochaetes bacterium GWF1_41_5]|nr:MAG: hypothetical protein A2096_13680 [Spirochaetes bacterium GWF1_41_5]
MFLKYTDTSHPFGVLSEFICGYREREKNNEKTGNLHISIFFKRFIGCSLYKQVLFFAVVCFY